MYVDVPVLVRTWEELANCVSETHVLGIEDGCGWIKPKAPSGDYCKENHYLSTHTFYGKNYKQSTLLLQSCGFNVQLANWDE